MLARFSLQLLVGSLYLFSVCSQREVPYVAGLWEVTYTYNEMVGPLDNLVENPCSGPFPYRYTWRIRIYQKVDTEGEVGVTTGEIRTCWEQWMDCPSESRKWMIVEGTPAVVKASCIFREYDEHPIDFARFPGYMRGGYQKKLVPTDKNTDPIPERLWSNFHVAEEEPVMFGTYCNQFSWFDQNLDVKIAPPYAGGWRHDNETWVFLRDISSCPCFPACVDCEESIPGTTFKQVKDDGGECLSRYGVRPQECAFTIKGVGGGPVRYPPETTGRDKDEFGNDQVCFQYANIFGYKLRGPEELPEILNQDWGDIGRPAMNPDPNP
mmetsp:Transcript_3174/g.6437  ORF Transcript_3174/g.6437 Transcript_3174/m.6437 type:complete len:323 (-) Transcript_3174:222-1190(-)